jgi:hypothetical protein
MSVATLIKVKIASTEITSIKRDHQAVCGACGEMLKHATEAGTKLLAIKTRMGHGGWEQWCADSFPDISLRTIQVYMRLAEPKHQRIIENKTKAQGAAPRSIQAAMTFLTQSKAKPVAEEPLPPEISMLWDGLKFAYVTLDEITEAHKLPANERKELAAELIKMRAKLERALDALT